jgi:DnaK suppressor protein
MPTKKKTKKVTQKKANVKKKVAKKATKKPAASKKKPVKKKVAKKTAAKEKPIKKKTAEKSPVKKKVAKKAAAKKKISKKPSTKKKITKRTILKKKVAKKTISNKKKITGNTKNKAMGKVTSIKKSPSKKTASASKTTIAPHKQKRKNEDYMGKDQTAHFREILLAWKKELMEEVDRTVLHMQDDATNFPDPNDRASQEEEFALELRTRDRERKLISKIEESISMLDSGDYGFCAVCGIEIGIRRLEARPTATQCIDCKTLDEIKERHLG